MPDDQLLESGWEELGLSDERASEIATAMVDDVDQASGVDFYKVRDTAAAYDIIRGCW